MSDQLRAELLKVRTTRTAVGLAAAMVVLELLIVLLTGLLSPAQELSSQRDQLSLLGSGDVGLTFSALAGLLLITSEYRYGTIGPTLLFTPQRSRVVVAKLAAATLTGFAYGAVATGVATGVGSLFLLNRMIPSALTAGQIALLVIGGLTGVALRGAFGVALGLIIRNQIAAIICLLAWDFVVNRLLFGLVPSVGRFTPILAANSLMGLETSRLLPAVAGGAVFLAWVAALAVAGLVLVRRRDVT